MFKLVIFKNLKEDKIVKEKDIEGKFKFGDVVGFWEGDDFVGFVIF